MLKPPQIHRFDVPEFLGRFIFEWHVQGGQLFLVVLSPPEKDGDLPKGEPFLLATDAGDHQRALELVALWRHGFHMGAKNPALGNEILTKHAPGAITRARLPADLMSALRGK
jgi:hypothetical protein